MEPLIMMWHETTGVTLVLMILVKKTMVTRYVCTNKQKKTIKKKIKSKQKKNTFNKKLKIKNSNSKGFSTFLCLHIFIAFRFSFE